MKIKELYWIINEFEKCYPGSHFTPDGHLNNYSNLKQRGYGVEQRKEDLIRSVLLDNENTEWFGVPDKKLRIKSAIDKLKLGSI